MSTDDILNHNWKENHKRSGITLLIVLALMVMFAMLVVSFMVITSQARRNAEITAEILIHPPAGTALQEDVLSSALQMLLVGDESLNSVIAAHSLLENRYGYVKEPESDSADPINPDPADPHSDDHTFASLWVTDESGKPYALRPNLLAPNSDGTAEYKQFLDENDVLMNVDYTAPDPLNMFLAWNDVEGGMPKPMIPSFHRPWLMNYWNTGDPAADDPNEWRKYVLRPLPTDHPSFTGSNPAAVSDLSALRRFLTEGPWDVDNDGDGRGDGIWLDIGLPAQQDSAGNWYKPLVSYLVLDMDGKINVNTVGNLAQYADTNNDSADDTEKGMGLGTADLTSDLLTEALLKQRYGDDGKPGGMNDDLLMKNGINLTAYAQGAAAADWFGITQIAFDDLGNRRPPAAQANFAEIPYLLNPYDETSGDKPFKIEDDGEPFMLSVIERYYETQGRLRDLLDPYFPDQPALTLPELRYSLTARSSDIPFIAPMLDKITKEEMPLRRFMEEKLYEGNKERADALWNLLPVEIRRGEKADINRLTLSGNWMTGDADLLTQKVRFAQEVFYLLQLLLYDPAHPMTAEKTRRLAQWSVNLVDFIDPDDTMTPFIFKKEGWNTGTDVFDNAALTSELLAGTITLPNDCELLWGMEKNEVLLTETLAVHDRKVGKNESGEYRQLELPQGSLFFEVYRQGNEQRTYSSSGLIDSENRLDLAKRTNNNGIGNGDGDYIWRIAIGSATKTSPAEDEWNQGFSSNNAMAQLLTEDSGQEKYPQFYQWHSTAASGAEQQQYHPDLGMPEQFVWFGKDIPSQGPAAENENRRRSFYAMSRQNENHTAPVLRPDSTFVVAPITAAEGKKKVYELGSGTTDGNKTIDLTEVNWMSVAVQLATPSMRGQYVMLNVSEPLPTLQLEDGYAPAMGGYRPPSPNTLPYDRGGVLYQRGTIPCYKTICLQRLADPNRPHDPVGNPYITVDWNMVDLHVVNSLDPECEEEIQGEEGDILFASRQWAKISSNKNIWDRTLTADKLTGNAGLQASDDDFHSFSPPAPDPSDSEPSDSNLSGYSTPLMHFPWNDSPLMNTGELMLVPSSAPGRFGAEFHDHGKSKKFFGSEVTDTEVTGEPPRFSYTYNNVTVSPYLHWGGFADGSIVTDLDLTILTGFAHVPSRFAGTRREQTDEPAGDSSFNVYREPGKINLNTLTEKGWEALQNGRELFPDYGPFSTFRNNVYNAGMPIRSPLQALLNMQWEEEGGTKTLLSEEASNPYTALENVMRLSDVTTVRSNVFAVWMTVGYFNAEKFDGLGAFQEKYPDLKHIDSPEMFEAVYPDGCVLGAEMGQGSGTLKRHRAFYMIDRSGLTDYIFQRGQALDTETQNQLILRETVWD